MKHTVDFIGVGAQKCGTSWVYACLYEHPEICAPIKEIHFFSRPRFEKGPQWYERHFSRCAEGKQRGEFSTSYLYSKEAPARIHSLYPQVKLIAIVRNPVLRAVSQYKNALKAGEIGAHVSFAQYAAEEKSVRAQGLYHEQLMRYLTFFKKEQILVLVYEDSKKNPHEFIKSIYHFLGVATDFVPPMLHSEVNIARLPKLVLIDKIMHRISESLRFAGLDRVVYWIRRVGLPDYIRSFNTKSAMGTAVVDTTSLKAYFTEDALKLSELLGRDMVAEWNLV